MDRRMFLISTGSALLTACTKSSPSAPDTGTTPLLTVLRNKGYAVTEHQNSYGGVFLIINGKMPRFNIGGVLIGENPAYSGDPTMNVGQYKVPNGIEPTFA